MISTVGSSFLSAYLEANKKLIQTITVKSAISAELTNEGVVKQYGSSSVDPYDPLSWKHYLNLAGKRHFSDKIIEVISLDSQEPIEFTPEMLELHPNTKAAYQFGTRYYYSLLRSFPDQEPLIRGVVNPANIFEAIDAVDGTILSYQSSLVEPQESSLMMDMDRYFRMYLARYKTPGYQTTDKYYTLAKFGVMAVHAIGHLRNLRQLRCHTQEAHSFHIREYLASFGKLDRFIPYLTLEQQLYLYRNIRYLNHHSGTIKQFEELIDKILVKRRIPLAAYSIRQVGEFDSDLYVKTRARRVPLTSDYNASEVQFIELSELFDKERQYTSGNADYLDLHQSVLEHKFKLTSSTVSQTKVLESALVDYSDAVPDPLPDVLLRQWVYMSHHDLYRARITYIDTITGETRNLSAKDAFDYLNYITLANSGIVVENIPQYLNSRFRLHPKPSLERLYSGVPLRAYDARKYIEQAWRKQPNINVCNSVQAFNTLATKIYDANLWQWYLLSNIHNKYTHGYVRTAIEKFYGLESIGSSGETIEAFLARTKLQKFSFSQDQVLKLSAVILKASTGFGFNEHTQLRYVQKKLVELFLQLSSYSIQVLAESNDSGIKPLADASVRWSHTGSGSGTGLQMYQDVRLLDIKGKATGDIVHRSRSGVALTMKPIKHSHVIKLNTGLDMMGVRSMAMHRMYLDTPPQVMTLEQIS